MRPYIHGRNRKKLKSKLLKSSLNGRFVSPQSATGNPNNDNVFHPFRAPVTAKTSRRLKKKVFLDDEPLAEELEFEDGDDELGDDWDYPSEPETDEFGEPDFQGGFATPLNKLTMFDTSEPVLLSQEHSPYLRSVLGNRVSRRPSRPSRRP